MFQVIGGAVGAVGDGIAKAVASIGQGPARFRVQPDQVFALANRFEEIAANIESASKKGAFHLFATPPGLDRPSVEATGRLIETAFGDAGLITRTRAYADELRSAAKALRETATQYGITDDTEGARFSASEI